MSQLRDPSDPAAVKILGSLMALSGAVTIVVLEFAPIAVAGVPAIFTVAFGLFFIWAVLGLPM